MLGFWNNGNRLKVYFRFKILLKLGSQNDPSLAEMFQGGMTELGEIYSCSQILCWTTGCCPYHTAWIARFALMCTALVTATEVTKTQATISVTSNSPKVPLQRQRVTSAGQSLQTNTERAGQHTAGVKLCKPSCLHGFLLWKRGWTKTWGTEFQAVPERDGCWRCPHPVGMHSTEPT